MEGNRALRRKKLYALVLIALGAVVLSSVAFSSGLFERFENALWDRRLKLVAARSGPDPRIRIITIDQSSLDFFAREERIYWPWPRALYEPVLRYLKDAGAAAVAFDILFTEPSAYGVDDDQQFANAIKGGPPVVLAGALRSGLKQQDNPAAWNTFRERQFARVQGSAWQPLMQSSSELFRSAVLPVDTLLESAAAVGNVSASPDADAVFRHVRAGGVIDGVPVLSLPFALFDLSTVDPGAAIERAQRIVQYDGRMAVRFAGGPRTYPTDPIAAIIQSFTRMQAGEVPLIDPERYKGAFVFVGMDAPGLLDLRPTPLAEVFPGVEYNATVFDNLLHANFFYRTSLVESIAVTVVLTLLLAGAALFAGELRLQVVALGVVLITFLGAAQQAALWGVWLPMAVPLFVAGLAVAYCFVLQFQLEGRQHRFLRHAFRHYVSGEVIDQIVENPASLAIGGERRELTIFFSDIEGFTKISERLEVSVLVALLNSFFSEMSSIILAHGGTVDKYVGDAIVAFWNAPVTRDDHAERGVRAAIACQQRLRALRSEYEEKFGVTVRMRIGVHTGIVNVGNFGSKDRFNYTMIGDAANLASRLEGANKYFGTALMISAATQRLVGERIACRRVAEILVVGKRQPTVVFEPLECSDLCESQIAPYDRARLAFEEGRLGEALPIFKSLSEDPVARRYIARIEHEMEHKGPFFPLFVLADK